MKKFLILFSLLALVACPRGRAPTALDASIAVATATAQNSISPSFAHFAGQSTFTLKPGGTESGTTYVTWPNMMTAAALSPGLKAFLIDDSISPAHATAGQWNIQNVTFYAANPQSSKLIWDVGATIDPAVTYFALRGGITFTSNNTSASVFTPNNASVQTLTWIDEFSAIQSAEGAQPFVHATQNFLFIYFVTGGSSLGGFSSVTGHALTIDTGVNAFVITQGPGFVNQHAIAGLGTLQKEPSVEATFSATQDVSSTVTSLFGVPTQIKYVPTTSTNWNPVPATVQNGLDQLAAPNFVQAANNTGTGTGTVSAVTGNIAKKRSGSVTVTCATSGSTSGAATVTVQLKRDSTNIGTTMQAILGAAGPFNIPATFVDTLPDTSNHTYTCAATAGAGTITTAASGIEIRAAEM